MLRYLIDQFDDKAHNVSGSSHIVSLASLPSFQDTFFTLSHRKCYSINYKSLFAQGQILLKKTPKPQFNSPGVTGRSLILHTPHTSNYVFLVLSSCYSINQCYVIITIQCFIYMHLVIMIMISWDEDINRSFLKLRLNLKSPELELELELKI